MLYSSLNKETATKQAKALQSTGRTVGLLNSNDYPSLRKGFWVVFSGQYETQKQAVVEATGLKGKVPGAYARFIGKK